MKGRRIDFKRIAGAALAQVDIIVPRWLPDGAMEGNRWVPRNPKRADAHPGSFKINMRTGEWGEWAGEKASGRDLISLACYLFGLKPKDAALRIAKMVGIDPYE